MRPFLPGNAVRLACAVTATQASAVSATAAQNAIRDCTSDTSWLLVCSQPSVPGRSNRRLTEVFAQQREQLRFALRPLDLRGDGVSILRAAAAEERFDFGVVVERAQPIDVAGGRPPQVDHRAVATASRSRTRTRDRFGSRLPSATPTRISARPPSAAKPKCPPGKIA